MASFATAHKMLGTAIVGVCLTSALAPASSHGDEPRQEKLVVCALPDAMPRTARDKDGNPRGLDLALVQLVSRQLGRKLEVHWCASASCSWNCLREGRCELIVGQPHGSGPAGEVAWSVPYAGSQFGLVVPSDANGIRSLADLRDKKLGIVVGTVAPAAKDHEVVRFKTRADLLDQFRTSQLDGAFMDADFAAWYLYEHPELKLRMVTEYVPQQHWNMAFMTRSKDSHLLVEVNRALAQIAESPQIQKIYADHGVPFRAPFTNSVHRTVSYNTWERLKKRGEILVSMDPANLPFSSAKEDLPGFDVEFVRALAQELGIKPRINWMDVHRETAIGQLLDGECDLAVGAVVDPGAVDDEQELAKKVVYSIPYYGTGYVLVQRKNGPRIGSLAELKGEKSRRLGAEAGSVADYRLRQRGYLRRLFPTQLAALKSLNDGAIDYAYLWANAGWTLRATPEFDLQLAPDYKLEDHWNVAIAMRRGDDQLKRHVDMAVEKLVDKGVVSRLLARYHTPYFPPDLEGKKGDAQVRKHAATNRGPEPQMDRRQRSVKSYAGLERIRAKGQLVVGLDQNNLPFSTAHPTPAGLDYEIAGLLAKQLGLPLQVYWAYSSHDSYPSKLATKELCDAILGVMPDDRFGQRVLFSKPYYVANYQLVTTIDRDKLSGVEPLAVESGIAVRGILGRNLKSYPNLEEVLAAVATGKETVGYVISTQGHWLAEKRWPGKLRFVDVPESVDKVPLCVALRKTDGELKDAIDTALKELAQSGQLAEVFARWNIPFTSAATAGVSAR